MFKYSELEKDALLHICITEPLRLGSAEIIIQNECALLAYDACARLHLLSAADINAAAQLLSGVENPYFILCCNAEFAPLLSRFGLKHSMRCSQFAWLKNEPPEADCRLQIAVPDDAAFETILNTYRMSSPDELRLQRSRGQLFFARDKSGNDIGFVGLHPEGCFGLLHVFEARRGMGYGAALEKFIIRWCMENGRVPYCQVADDNAASIALQKKLGLSQTTQHLLMAWNDA